jgi:hypothetical protein
MWYNRVHCEECHEVAHLEWKDNHEQAIDRIGRTDADL